ncbi:MAG TPA: hypothetical protein HPQ04_02525 [Rhodospirillaceae bacterium]|nr:hypothetical protein [Rhodospirillaceae bacterium]
MNYYFTPDFSDCFPAELEENRLRNCAFLNEHIKKDLKALQKKYKKPTTVYIDLRKCKNEKDLKKTLEKFKNHMKNSRNNEILYETQLVIHNFNFLANQTVGSSLTDEQKIQCSRFSNLLRIAQREVLVELDRWVTDAMPAAIGHLKL